MDVTKLFKFIDCKVAFTTDMGNFEGILKLILLKGDRLTFEHVFCRTSREYLGTMHVLSDDIFSCDLLEPAHKILDWSKFDSSKELLTGGIEQSSKIDDSENISIPLGKHFLDFLPPYLKDKCPTDFCIIDDISTVFHKAISDLSRLNTVGVSFYGPKISRRGILSWICMSSSNCIFLFDIQQLGEAAFKRGLKSIFESEDIQKVIHDCREATDCLLHMFHTDLKNVFDTQASDYAINMQMYTGSEQFNYVSSLDTCLVKYLKVPQQFLYNRNKCLTFEEETKFYELRPISEEFCNVLLKSTMYLITLQAVQEKILYNPYEKLVDLYLNILPPLKDSDVYLQKSTEKRTSAPDYLLESAKVVKFIDLMEFPDDYVEKMKATLHGQEAWKNRHAKRHKPSNYGTQKL